MSISRQQRELREMNRRLAERTSADPSAQAAVARKILAESSPAAAMILARRADRPVRRDDPERWRRADEAAEIALAASPRAREAWAPEPEVDEAERARRESMARALRRARQERADKG